jgi:1,2-beta-oligoglucan phosphorylase
MTAKRSFTTAIEGGLGLARIANAAGIEVSVLPNGCIFALEHAQGGARTMINQLLGSPLGAGIGRILLRLGGDEPRIVEAMGPSARVAFGVAADRAAWQSEAGGLRHRVTLWLHPSQAMWLWRLDVENGSGREIPCDAIFVQDLGLGPRGFVMSNEAYASQYIDHTVCAHPRFGPVVMSRQNMAQDDRHPWVAHACLEGAESFATDALQLFGPAYRDAETIALGFGESLPGERLQHECACAILQTKPANLTPGERATWTFCGVYEPDAAEPTSEADLARIDAAAEAARDFAEIALLRKPPVRSILQDAAPLQCIDASAGDSSGRLHEEWRDGRLISYFVQDGALNRHVVAREKDRIVRRRHGAIVRSGGSLLPADDILCATGWMHGVFAARLAIGNTSFHKLFSVSRDAYNVARASGLRILAEIGGAWRLLALPSRFEMGLSDCRWEYRHDGGAIVVHAIASGEDAALQIGIEVEGAPCSLLVFGHLVMGEHDYAQSGRVEVDEATKRLSLRPSADWLWGQRYPNAAYHIVTSTPGAVDALGGDELLYVDGVARGMPFAALRTHPTNRLRFAIVGSMTDAGEAERLATKHEAGVEPVQLLAGANAFWASVTRNARIEGSAEGAAAFDTLFPWLAHDALIHVSAPHGLEQYSGGAWGARDVCQGPIEFFLALRHDEAAKDVLRGVFARQRRSDGDWPQWFFLAPYEFIQSQTSHGDIIVWPLKALCDYIEATGDIAFLEESVPWPNADGTPGGDAATVAGHIEALLKGAISRFIPGTSLMRYGEGDWNDTLQPANLALREWLVSSWTNALFFWQLVRYVDVLRRTGQSGEAERLSKLADAVREDFHRHLVRDGVVAGYALFDPDGWRPEVLLHPSDEKTGVSYSLIPMSAAIAGGLFTPEQARHHARLIREHLMFPDGVRLMDKPLPYRGGAELIFRRAESSPFFGREVGLMYVQAHLRFCEAMATLGETEALWEGLRLADPIEPAGKAAPRQRNCYYTSSDAAFRDRYEASAEWVRLKAGAVPVEGGWRIYSGGPGLFIDLLVRRAGGVGRRVGEGYAAALLPQDRFSFAMDGGGTTRGDGPPEEV